MSRLGLALFTVALVFAAAWSLVLQGQEPAARSQQSGKSVGDRANTGSSSAPTPGVSAVATKSVADEAIKLHTGGSEFTRKPAVAPPVVSEQAAIDTARARMDGGGTVIQSEPVAEHWLVTYQGQPDPQALTYMFKRPMWVVTFDQVLNNIRGPANRSPDVLTSHRAIAYVLIDSHTGQIIKSMADGLEPISPPDAVKDDCSKVAC